MDPNEHIAVQQPQKEDEYFRKLRERIEALEDSNKTLTEAIATLTKAVFGPKRKPGRPPKVKET
jgi:hypothetical protein